MPQNTILIVEDNERINRLFYKQLSTIGYNCVSVYSIGGAIQMLNQCEPDMIILDLELGDGVGTDVLDYLKSRNRDDVKVVVVSANAFSSRHNIRGYKVNHVLLKPTSPRQLAAVVHHELHTGERVRSGR